MIVSTMVAKEPVEPLGFAAVSDKDEKQVYIVAVVMGSENVERFTQICRELRPNLLPVDIDFDKL